MNKDNKIVPKLRFPEFQFSKEWILEPFSEIYSFLGTNSFTRDNLNYRDGNIKNIHYGDIHTKFNSHFDITKEIVPFVNLDITVEKIKEEFFCKEGDIIFADASEDLADVGKSIEIIYLNNEKILSGLHTLLARQKDSKLRTGFGGHLFKSSSIRTQIQKESQGAKVLGISATRLSNISVYYPENKDEQQKIASCLSSLDELIAAHTYKLEALKDHKKGLMQQLFPAEGETVPKLRFKEFEGDGEWVETTLNKLGNLIGGLTYSPNDIRNEGLLVLRSSNIQNGLIDLNDCVYVTTEVKGANLIQPNDILICVRNGSKSLIGKNAIIPKDIPFATHGAFMTVFRAYQPSFIFQLFQTDLYSNQVKADLGATINSINGSNLLKYKFIVPQPNEQQKIANFLSSIDDEIAAQVQKIEGLKEHKKGLMQGLFPVINE
ncbi:restriction modification system DNA specificity domain [Paludibacter propionicigenes WB4]|uniref:Restriction modification system DNA specificity domain n=1 Tax=Paludibacter propionicigenes (strain DSM 17365 / JCM 13257 / WB4) TaxID=694427 RepID=E4T5V3_PALPW|nr:restriction endonuclease subunit S [Paludibacter propionicigenes]ADQ80097.1 restriction modification system DNA specificity domain [Paludibacter propionicigenes WB4]